MRFIADESCDFAIVRALRQAGYDVGSITEIMPGAPDAMVAELAIRESRILLTEDKDFGQLYYAASTPSSGVLLIRFPGHAGKTAINTTVNFIISSPDQRGRFIVVQPGRIRISKRVR